LQPACLFLIDQYETSFDNFHKNNQRIYRVVAATKTQAGMNYSKGTAPSGRRRLTNRLPATGAIARIYARDDKQITLLNDKASAAQTKFKGNVFLPSLNFSTYSISPSLAGRSKNGLVRTKYRSAYTGDS